MLRVVWLLALLGIGCSKTPSTTIISLWSDDGKQSLEIDDNLSATTGPSSIMIGSKHLLQVWIFCNLQIWDKIVFFLAWTSASKWSNVSRRSREPCLVRAKHRAQRWKQRATRAILNFMNWFERFNWFPEANDGSYIPWLCAWWRHSNAFDPE